MIRLIRGVLFDLGGTLMHAGGPWGPVEARADRALADDLRRHGVNVPPRFPDEFRSRLMRYYDERDETLVEETYFLILQEMLAQRGYTQVSEDIINSALGALYSTTRENWALERDTLLVLRMLESAGYRMGLVSNAGDDKDVQMLVEQFGIASYFDFILTSAACGYRKPHPRIFEAALGHWDFPAQEVAMVGDTLEADIVGANLAGLYSIWITRRVLSRRVDPAIKPDASVGTLIEIPELLGSLAQEPA